MDLRRLAAREQCRRRWPWHTLRAHSVQLVWAPSITTLLTLAPLELPGIASGAGMSQNPSYLRHRGQYTRATTQCRPPSPVCEIADGGEWCAPEWRHISNPITLTPNSKRAATSGQTGHRWQPQRRPRQLKSTTGHQVGCGRCDTRRRLTVAHLHAHTAMPPPTKRSRTRIYLLVLSPRVATSLPETGEHGTEFREGGER